MTENWVSGSTLVNTSTVNIVSKCLPVYLLNERPRILKLEDKLVTLKVILAAMIDD